MGNTVSVDQLANAINAALQEYATLAAEDMKRCITDAGTTVRKEIKSHAPKESGEYGKSWRVKKEYENAQTVTYTVYSPKRYYLAHLLEHGHAKRCGGRVSARPHIAPAEEIGEKSLIRDLERALASH